MDSTIAWHGTILTAVEGAVESSRVIVTSNSNLVKTKTTPFEISIRTI
jgi:hypothetical protein